MPLNFPINPNINDEVRGSHTKWVWQGDRWKKHMYSFLELQQRAGEAAQAAIVQQIADAEQAKADALAAKQEAETAATTAAGAANVVVGELTANAPETLDTFAEIAEAITKATVVLKSASFNITGADANKVMFINTTNAVTVTLPTDSTIPTGTEIAFIRNNTGTVTFAVTGGASLSSAENKLSIKNQYGTAAVIKVNDFDWVLTGSLE